MIKTILFQGDSITDAHRNREAPIGNGQDMGCGYAALTAGKLLAANLGREFCCINRGNGGNKVVDLYARWKIDALNLKPDLLLSAMSAYYNVAFKDIKIVRKTIMHNGITF